MVYFNQYLNYFTSTETVRNVSWHTRENVMSLLQRKYSRVQLFLETTYLFTSWLLNKQYLKFFSFGRDGVTLKSFYKFGLLDRLNRYNATLSKKAKVKWLAWFKRSYILHRVRVSVSNYSLPYILSASYLS